MADVDAGGTSYRSGLDVIDLGGLGDRVLGRAFTRDSGRVVDYLFGERRPDTIHVHGPWQKLIPVDQLFAFNHLYRPLDNPSLTALGVGVLTAIRADLVDPPARPAVTRVAQLEGARLVGLSSVAVAHQQVLFLHARGEGGQPTLFWRTPDGVRHPVSFHAGLGLTRSPAGAPLVGSVRLPADALPLLLEGVQDLAGTPAPFRVERWPSLTPASDTVEGLARLALVRLAGAPFGPCDPTPLLDAQAPLPSRLRGATFVAQLCGVPPAAVGARLAAEARAFANDADADVDDRYDAAAAVVQLAPPASVADRQAIERARTSHQRYDEILHAFAEGDLAEKTPTADGVARGLATLLAARDYGEILLQALAFGWIEHQRYRPVLCAAAAQLGLRAGAVSPLLDCRGVKPAVAPRVARPRWDADVVYKGTATGWRARAAHPGQRRILGGAGGWFLNTYLGPDAPPPGSDPNAEGGEVVWGPLPLPGCRFGVLVAGGGKSASGVRLEEQRAGEWREVWRSSEAPSVAALAPQLAELSTAPGTMVRVRVVEDAAARTPLLVDAPTFLETEPVSPH
jgi:hypothetical protein